MQIKHLCSAAVPINTTKGKFLLYSCPERPCQELLESLAELEMTGEIKSFRYIADSVRPVLLVEA